MVNDVTIVAMAIPILWVLLHFTWKNAWLVPFLKTFSYSTIDYLHEQAQASKIKAGHWLVKFHSLTGKYHHLGGYAWPINFFLIKKVRSKMVQIFNFQFSKEVYVHLQCRLIRVAKWHILSYRYNIPQALCLRAVFQLCVFHMCDGKV